MIGAERTFGFGRRLDDRGILPYFSLGLGQHSLAAKRFRIRLT